jgi:hypothetical protein
MPLADGTKAADRQLAAHRPLRRGQLACGWAAVTDVTPVIPISYCYSTLSAALLDAVNFGLKHL